MSSVDYRSYRSRQNEKSHKEHQQSDIEKQSMLLQIENLECKIEQLEKLIDDNENRTKFKNHNQFMMLNSIRNLMSGLESQIGQVIQNCITIEDSLQNLSSNIEMIINDDETIYLNESTQTISMFDSTSNLNHNPSPQVRPLEETIKSAKKKRIVKSKSNDSIRLNNRIELDQSLHNSPLNDPQQWCDNLENDGTQKCTINSNYLDKNLNCDRNSSIILDQEVEYGRFEIPYTTSNITSSLNSYRMLTTSSSSVNKTKNKQSSKQAESTMTNNQPNTSKNLNKMGTKLNTKTISSMNQSNYRFFKSKKSTQNEGIEVEMSDRSPTMYDIASSSSSVVNVQKFSLRSKSTREQKTVSTTSRNNSRTKQTKSNESKLSPILVADKTKPVKKRTRRK